MASLTPPKWIAEVAVDEPERSSLPVWSLGRIESTVSVLDVAPGAVPMSDMVAWLQQRSIGDWRFVERERVSGRVSLIYRAFEFEQIADARLFAREWSNALIQMRVESLDRQIANIPSAVVSADGAHFLDRALTWLLDETPLRLRVWSLLRLRGQSGHGQVHELVALIDH